MHSSTWNDNSKNIAKVYMMKQVATSAAVLGTSAVRTPLTSVGTNPRAPTASAANVGAVLVSAATDSAIETMSAETTIVANGAGIGPRFAAENSSLVPPLLVVVAAMDGELEFQVMPAAFAHAAEPCAAVIVSYGSANQPGEIHLPPA